MNEYIFYFKRVFYICKNILYYADYIPYKDIQLNKIF